jgi:hypothetical protein
MKVRLARLNAVIAQNRRDQAIRLKGIDICRMMLRAMGVLMRAEKKLYRQHLRYLKAKQPTEDINLDEDLFDGFDEQELLDFANEDSEDEDEDEVTGQDEDNHHQDTENPQSSDDSEGSQEERDYDEEEEEAAVALTRSRRGRGRGKA